MGGSGIVSVKSINKGAVARKWYKKLYHKLLRRKAKVDPENAPGRVRDVTRGYW